MMKAIAVQHAGSIGIAHHALAARPAARQQPAARRHIAVLASGNEANGTGPTHIPPTPSPPESSAADSDVAFILKLATVSFICGAAIKYGSLLADLPFNPNAAVAVAFVATPPAIYLAWLLQQKD